MKLVIEIDEKDYKDFQLQSVMLNPVEPSQRAKLAIANGTPYEERKGKWVLAHPLQEDDGGAYVCSCCKSGSYEVIPKTWKACPWCTALMEVDE